MERHSYNLGILGNCAYLAYVDTTANISWLCWPQFDSPFIFGGLLDQEKGGHFWIRPAQSGYESRQQYLENTNIIYTEFTAPDGKFRVVDFAPRFQQYDRYFKPLMLLRKIEPISGSPKVVVSCRPVGAYGTRISEVQIGSNHLRYSGLDQQVRLTTDIPLTYVAQEKAFVLSESKYIVLSWGIPLEAPLESTFEDFLRKTRHYWENWVMDCSIGRFYQEPVIRSALAVKLHQFQDTGAIIAAGTTSLPESPKSGRNWDYRYCWLRDSHYTLTALNHLGHFNELELFANYLRNVAVSETGRFNPVYSITNESELLEKEVPLAGYLGNQPVRVGNLAYVQAQHDLYGQLLVSLLPLYVDKRFSHRARGRSLDLIHRLLSGIEATMNEPDAGLWEFRGTVQEHCYTFLFHWAGSSAAARIAQSVGDTEMLTRAKRLRKAAKQKIEACWDPELGAYTQAIGSKNLDASLLQLITMKYLDPQSERAESHLAALEKGLRAENGLFYRYSHADDFGKPEVTFLICAYWYVEALASVGRIEDAVVTFNQLLKYSNHLGLLSEDVDSRTGCQWGNFPQVYSHVGLINAAFRITNKVDRPLFLEDGDVDD